MSKNFQTVTYFVILCGGIFISTLWSHFAVAANETTCPWGLDSDPAIASLKKVKVDVEFNCPAKINDPTNAAIAAKLRDFYSESLAVFSKETPLLEELAKRDFIRVLRFSSQTIKSPDYRANERVLTYGLFSNDASTFGNKLASRENSIQLFKNLVSAWNNLFKGRPVLPENYTSVWGDQTRHKDLIDSLTREKAQVDKALAFFKGSDITIKIVGLGNFTYFSNGYLALDSANFGSNGEANDVLNLVKVYAKIPASVSSKIAISCGLGCERSMFLYTLKLEGIFDKIGSRWAQIASASPKVRTIVFNLGANFPAGAFNYDSETKTVSMPIGFSGIFEEEIFLQSLDKISKL